MKNIFAKVTAIGMALLLSGTIISPTVPALADVDISGEKDDMEVKTYLNEIAYSPENRLEDEDGRLRISGWDFNQIGGEVTSLSSESLALGLNDTSSVLPVEATREFEAITYGKAELYFDITIGTGVKDASVSLRNGTDSPIYYGIDDKYIWVKDPEEKNGRKNLVSYKADARYLIYTVFDMDNKTFDVYIDNVQYASDISFTADKIDNFFFSSGKETVGKLSLKRDTFSLKRGYWIDESFGRGNGGTLPANWTLKNSSEKDVSVPYYTAKQGIKVGTSGTETLSRYFDKQTRDFTAEFYIRIPDGCNDATFGFTNDGKNVFQLKADKNSLYYIDSSGSPVVCYNNYKKDLWYIIWADVKLSTKTFDLYVDDKKVKSDIPLPKDAAAVDRFSVTGGNGAPVYLTGIQVYPTETFDDYVPEPTVKESKDVDIGMQYFGLWNEGGHFGWDWVNDSDFRRPLDGFYDEDSVEHWDWQIKYWVEHGIDYVAPCWYALGQWTEGVSERVRHPFFKAKYSDKMKFALLMETSGWAGWQTDENGANAWLQQVGRQMIEYYFKDPRYYTNGGRPVVFMFGWEQIQNAFPNAKENILDKLGDMCEAEGLKRPLYILHFGEGFNNWTDSVTKGKAFGGDAFYHYSMSNWSQHAVDANLENIDIAKANGYDYVPTVSTGFDDYSWNREVGYRRSSDQVKWEVEQYKEKMLPKLKDLGELKTPMLNLATWNEWGEGHYYGPSEGFGFSFLDDVRDVLTDGGNHTDVTPDEHQKDRFNNLYPYWRKTRVREVNVGETPSKDAYEKYTWNFDDNKNSPGWSADSSSIDNGVMKINTGDGRAILSLEDKNIDTANVTHVKIRMKNKGSANSVLTSIKTPFWDTASSKRTMHTQLTVQNMKDSDDYIDFYIPVGEYAEFWRGILDEMNISFDGCKSGESIEIDSISFMALKDEKSVSVKLDGWTCDTDVKMVNGLPFLPLRSVSDKWKGQIWYEAQTGKVWVKSGNTITKFTPGSETVECNVKEYNLPNSSILEDGTTWVNAEILALTFNKQAVWDPHEKTLLLNDVSKDYEVPRSNEERKKVWSFEFDSVTWNDDKPDDAWNYSSGMDMSAANGIGKFSTSSTDPQFAINTPSIDLSQAKYLCIGVQANKTFDMQIFYDTGSGINEGNSYTTTVKSSDSIQEIMIDISKMPGFSGTMSRIRIDPGTEAGITGSFDYIRLYGDFEKELTDEDIAERVNSREDTDEGVVWNFNINSIYDGWQLSTSLANVTTKNGILSADIICKSPFFETAQGNLGVNAADYDKVKFSLANSTDSTHARVYFVTDDEPIWSEDKSVEVEILNNNSTCIVYTADLSSNAKYNGNVKALRLAIEDMKYKEKGGRIGIDYIKLLKKNK